MLKKEKSLSSQLKKPERGKEELKKLVPSKQNRKQVIGSQSRLMSLGGINYSTKTSLERQASTSGFPPSKKSLKAKGDTCSASTRL